MSGHIVISGTGRAGTSFLVAWLAACGLDVGEFPDGGWYAEADAGLERTVLPPAPDDPPLPRVVKDPWLPSYLDRVDLALTPVDVLIVPVRRLADAAASRIRLEKADIHRRVPGWPTESGVFGRVPGGVLYSYAEADVERLLAVAFHGLLRWAVENDVPTVLLDYPRLLDDPVYLCDRLAPWLPNLELAVQSHALLSKGSRP